MSDAPSNWPAPGGPVPPSGYGVPGQPGQYPGPGQFPGPGQPGQHPAPPGPYPEPGPYGGRPGPGPGYGAPTYGPPTYGPPPAKSKKKGCLIAAGIFAVIVLLGIGGCAVALRAGFRTLTAPVDASNRWLDAIDERDDDEVQRLTCPSLRNDLDQVARLLERNDWDGSQDLDSSEIVNARASVSGTVGTPGGDVSITLSLARATGDRGHRGWCVDGVTIV